jgi:diguanylate cyclase (GGDEF)-like protein
VLRRCARDSDVIGRLGGDEFAVFMHIGNQDPPIPAIVERLLVAARRSGIHVSVGATATVPGRHSSLEDLLSVADETMYRGRRARRSA